MCIRDRCELEGANEHQVEESQKAVAKMEVIIGDPDRLRAVACYGCTFCHTGFIMLDKVLCNSTKSIRAVSYTHLDVYKRQQGWFFDVGFGRLIISS